MRFVALDFETANSTRSSICQIGVAVFHDYCLVQAWQTLVDPEEEFSGFNIQIHGIQPEHVKDAPTFPEVFNQLRELLVDQIVVHHSSFDKQVLSHGITKYGLPALHCRWLDTTAIAKHAWPEFQESGYSLKNLAQALQIPFDHHAAHEDARAAGEVLIRAIQQKKLDLTEWLVCNEQTINPSPHRSRRLKNDPNVGHSDSEPISVAALTHLLTGKTIVVTGKLKNYKRDEIEELIRTHGGRASSSVSKKTDFVLAGDEAGSKLEKAKQLGVKVIDEAEFERLITG